MVRVEQSGAFVLKPIGGKFLRSLTTMSLGRVRPLHQAQRDRQMALTTHDCIHLQRRSEPPAEAQLRIAQQPLLFFLPSPRAPGAQAEIRLPVGLHKPAPALLLHRPVAPCCSNPRRLLIRSPSQKMQGQTAASWWSLPSRSAHPRRTYGGVRHCALPAMHAPHPSSWPSCSAARLCASSECAAACSAAMRARSSDVSGTMPAHNAPG